jgi:MoaA/NifB/PqqE/SkfB family radical SAM enzyme
MILKTVCPNAQFSMVSNGLATERILSVMTELRRVDKNVTISISIDGLEETDSLLRGDPTHFQKAWKTVHALRAKGFSVCIGSMVTPKNIDELERLSDECVAHGIKHILMVVNKSRHYYANHNNTELQALQQIDTVKLKKIIKKINQNYHHYYLPKYLRNPRQMFPCFSGFTSFFLNAVGNVYPCIHLDHCLGNITQQTLGEVWNSDYAQQIRYSIVKKYCHCYTPCETQGWLMANIFPKIIRGLAVKLGD